MKIAMHMSFYWGKDVITILFVGWPEGNAGMYALAFLFVLLLGVTVEVLSVLATAKFGTNPKLGALIQAFVHTIRMAFAYMAMLAVMSYNLGIFIAALAGHGIGMFLVRARSRLAADGRAKQESSTSEITIGRR